MPSNSAVDVLDGVDGDADAPHFAERLRVVRIEAQQRGQVEVGRQPGLPGLDHVFVTAVRGLGIAEPGDLPDRPGPAAIHRRIDTARERISARKAQLVCRDLRNVGGGVDPLQRNAAFGSIGRVLFRPAVERGCELFALPLGLLLADLLDRRFRE